MCPMAEELIDVASLIKRIREGPCLTFNCDVVDVKVRLGGSDVKRGVSSLMEVDLVRDRAYLTVRFREGKLRLIIRLEIKGSASLGELRELSRRVTELLSQFNPVG